MPAAISSGRHIRPSQMFSTMAFFFSSGHGFVHGESTNPGATPVNKIINVLKGRNAIIIAPSPKGYSTCALLLEYVHAELDRAYAATEKAFAGVPIRELVESASPIIPLCDSPR